MAAEFDSPSESGKVAGIALEFPACESTSPTKVPRRIRQRLLESSPSSSSSTLEEIEAKLREADLRRQQFHEWLSNKARPKPRSPSWSSQDEDLAQRLEAKLYAAEQKRCWRRFLKSRRTTFALAKAYEALEINDKSVRSMPFEQLAVHIESAATLQTVKSLLDRLESRFMLSQASLSRLDNIDHLLKRLASPNRRGGSNNTAKTRGTKKGSKKETKSLEVNKLLRYPTRVVLCAYMILGHPDAVFNGQGECEVALAESAANFIQEFELLVKIILDGPSQSNSAGSSRQSSPDIMADSLDIEESAPSPTRRTFRSQLAAFDAAWCSYLYRFVAWKVKDARSLEEDLVRAACQLELSMMQTCKLTPEGSSGDLTHDMRAIQKQVSEDQKLLREKVQHLSGSAGIERMECALSDTRSKYFEAKENGSPTVPPIAHISSSTPSSSAGPSVPVSEQRSPVEGSQSSHRVVRSLFKDAPSSSEVASAAPRTSDAQPSSSTSENLVTENELLVNEILHAGPRAFADSFVVSNEDQTVIQAKIKETMEKAFWDGIAESLKEDEPDYGRIVLLVKEVRDELCEMAPKSWKQEIHEAIDLDILSQVLKSGTLDMDYLERILEYSLATLQKLSAPAKEDEMRKAHQNLLSELAEIACAGGKLNSSFVIATIKGLRFVLEQIQELKREISKARIRMMEPFIKGPAGFEYLQKAFADRYGHPSDAASSLPLTVRWLESVHAIVEEEWDEHKDSLSALTMGNAGSSQGLPPASSLRTGGAVPVSGNQVLMVSHSQTSATGDQLPECNGGRVDMLVRLGLLRLVCGVEGMTQEALPETLKLNFSRLRAVQSQLQKIIVISTSMLVLRQILLSENSATSSTNVEAVISDSVKRLSELLDRVTDAGIAEIVETALEPSSSAEDREKASSMERLQARKKVMASMLAKSLQAGDAVFSRVAQVIYLAARGIVFGGSTTNGCKLADTALRRVGSAVLSDRVVEAAEVLVVTAMVSGQVHGPWYSVLVENI
ncbi:uncharacterized protein LOC131242839 isoform X3 [Magnolia sinica]|uniref:uncharacterized protein LOC131242839 isoform X3 n=1 Tax=Magnolia sinica TaxID=86752 RepID=UPI002659B67D|nr:uncharacterized protein LOC131242839 isoform X3 [Magnolia sinica]